MEDDGAHVGREHRRRRVRLADDDLRRMDDLALLEDPRHELRHVVPDVELAQVLRHPAPALHVDDQALRVRAGSGPGCRLSLLDAGVERGARARRQDARGLDVVLLLERAAPRPAPPGRRVFSAPRGSGRPSRWRSSAMCGCSLPSLRVGPSAAAARWCLRLHRLRRGSARRAPSAAPGAAAGTARAWVAGRADSCRASRWRPWPRSTTFGSRRSASGRCPC